MPARRFLLILVLAAAALLLAAASLNWWIDPVGFFGRRTDGLHYVYSRESKAGLLRTSRADNRAVLFGTSLMLGFDPQSVPDRRLMNLAMSGQEPAEVAYMVEHLVRDQDLVVLVADVTTGLRRDPAFVQKPFAAYDLPNLAKFALSHEATYMSLGSLVKRVRGNAPRLDRWAYEPQPYVWAANPYGERYDNYIKVIVNIVRDSETTGKLDAYRKIRGILAARAIPLQVVLAPINEDVLAAVARAGLDANLARWRAAMTEIFPDLLDLTTSEFSARGRYPFDEAVHFDPATATAIVRAALAHHANRPGGHPTPPGQGR